MGQPTNPGSPGIMAVKMVCMCVCLMKYNKLLWPVCCMNMYCDDWK